MNAQSTAIAPHQEESNGVLAVKRAISTRADEFKAILPAHISVDKFQRTVATAVLTNPTLLNCDRQSFMVACMKLAQDGLLPDGREAALVPFKTRKKDDQGWYDAWDVTPMPMAYGLRKKVLQSGEVISLQVGVVYAAEVRSGNFVYEIGIEPPVRHRPKLDMTEQEMADDQLVAAYSIARIKNGDAEPVWSAEVMRRAEVLKVRQMSQTGALNRTDRKGNAIPPKGPWVDWEPEMWKKTVLRRHTKVLPMSGDILDAFERDLSSENAADSAAAFLSAGNENTVRLPSNDELDEMAGDDDGVDPDTGEVLRTDSRGFTEVDEETARALDQGNDGTLADDNPNADEGPADEQRGEQVEEKAKPARQAKPKAEAPKEEPSLADDLRQRIARANDIATLSEAQELFGESKSELADADIADIRNKLAERRNALS